MANSSKTFSSVGILLLVLLAICFLALPAHAKYGGGTGEPNDPYLIYTAEQMNEVGLNEHEDDWDKHFKLMANIDLSGFTGDAFNIIGYMVSSDNKPFTGVFDGSGHTISNFTYTSTDKDNIGLFGYINDPNAEVKDLGLVDPNVDAGSGYFVGSLVGRLRRGTVTNCYVEGGSIAGDYLVGGLVGDTFYGTITNSHSEADVSGTGWGTGGLVGGNGYHGTITNSYATGTVSGDSSVGGLVGVNGGTITNCYADGDSVSGNSSVGGLVGVNGWRLEGATITDCYSTGNVAGDREVGGLVGYNYYGTITNCYATGGVEGEYDVGGLVGRNQVGSISNCYSISDVNGVDDVGGLVGKNSSDGIISNCFWDIDIGGPDNGYGTPLPTEQMQTMSTFTDAGWDFSTPIWKMNCEGMSYPKLSWWQPVLGDFGCPDGVDFVDYSFFASHWAEDNCGASNDCDGTDLDQLDTVDINDLRIFVDNWLSGF